MKKFYLITAVIFLALSIITNRSYVHHINTRLDIGDNLFVAWTLAWDNHSELTGNIFHIFDANIYYPNKDTLTYSDNLLGVSLLTLPVYALSHNPALIFNVVLILSFVFNALSAEVLGYYFIKNKYAAFIVGLIWGFCAYKVWGMAHLQNLLCWWIPIGIYFLHKYFDERKTKYLVLLSICFVAQVYSSLYVAAAMAFLYLIIGGYLLFRSKAWNLTPKFIIALVIIGILLIPVLYPYYEFAKQTHATFAEGDLDYYSSDLGGYLLPSRFQIESLFINLNKVRWVENFSFIGYIALVLALIGVFKLKIKNKFLEVKVDLSNKKGLEFGEKQINK